MKKLLSFLLAGSVFSGVALAQTPPPPAPPRSINVSGESHAEFAPDEAILSMSLVSKDKNLHTAKVQNDAMVEKLVNIAKDLSIPREKIATSNVSISPQYTYDNAARQQQFTGYTVSRSFRVTMDKLDVPEKLLAAVVDAKIDQVNGIDFDLADPAMHETELKVKAFADAKAKAEALAQAAGVKLGPVQMIDAQGGEMPIRMPRPMAMMAGAMAAAAPSVAPTLPGMVELHETVSVSFGIE